MYNFNKTLKTNYILFSGIQREENAGKNKPFVDLRS